MYVRQGPFGLPTTSKALITVRNRRNLKLLNLDITFVHDHFTLVREKATGSINNFIGYLRH